MNKNVKLNNFSYLNLSVFFTQQFFSQFSKYGKIKKLLMSREIRGFFSTSILIKRVVDDLFDLINLESIF